MRIRLVMLTVIFAAPYIGLGQNFVFKVLANKGETHYKTLEIADWKPLKHGIGLQNNDLIRIGSDSYLGLIHSSGRITEVDEPGEMRISDLDSNLKQMKKGLPSKYIEFVYNTVASSDLGNVLTRGIDDIHVYLPAVGQVYGDEVLLLWKEYEGMENFNIFISDIMADEILLTSVTGTSLVLDLSVPELENENIIILKVTSEGLQSKEYVLSRLSKEKSEAVTAELGSFINDLDLGSPVGHALLGAFYEGNDLIIDALSEYYAADGGDYENYLFRAFLSRHGMLK